MPTRLRYVCMDKNAAGRNIRYTGKKAIAHFCSQWHKTAPEGAHKIDALMAICREVFAQIHAAYRTPNVVLPSAQLMIIRENRNAIKAGRSGYAFSAEFPTRLKKVIKKENPFLTFRIVQTPRPANPRPRPVREPF